MPRIPIPPRLLRYAAFLSVVSVVVYFSLLDAPAPPGPTGPWYDKQLHFAAYAAVTVTAAGASIEYRNRRWGRIAGVVAFSMAFGIAIELAQWPLVGRYASIGDVAANAAGTLLGSVTFAVEDAFGYVDDQGADARG